MLNPFRKEKSWKQVFDEGMKRGAVSDLEGAAKAFREAIRLAPNEPYPHYELGYTLFLQDKYAEALVELRRTDELSTGFFLVQTEIYMCEQILSGAIDSEILGMLRVLQRLTDGGQGHGRQAVEIAKQTISRAPGCALGHFYLGKALLGSEPAAGEETLKRCLELNPDDTTAINILLHLALLARNSGRAAEAASICREISEKYKGNAHVAEVQLVS